MDRDVGDRNLELELELELVPVSSSFSPSRTLPAILSETMADMSPEPEAARYIEAKSSNFASSAHEIKGAQISKIKFPPRGSVIKELIVRIARDKQITRIARDEQITMLK